MIFVRVLSVMLVLLLLSGCSVVPVGADADLTSGLSASVESAVDPTADTVLTETTAITEAATALPSYDTDADVPDTEDETELSETEIMTQEPEVPAVQPTRIAVPRMAARPLEEARQLLEDAGIDYTVSEQYSKTHPAGEVITVHFHGVLDETHCHINPSYPVEVVVSLGNRYKTNVVSADPKRIYLTFDDGPHPNTDKVLQILAEYDVSATFFTLGTYVSVYPERTKAIADAGHLLACHSYSHNYETLYASGESVLAEIHAWEAAVERAGVAVPKTVCFRFPGGSTTYYMDDERYEEIFWTVNDAGYHAFDWTFANNDRYLNHKTEDQTLLEYLQESVITTLDNVELSPTWPKIMLMHDTADETVESLPWILAYLIEEGYTFGTLDELDGYWVFK